MREFVRYRGPQISASGLMFVFSFLVALSFMMAANMRFYSMAKEVNQRLPRDAQINVWGWRHERDDVLRLHAEMYPTSPKRWQFWTLFFFGAVFGFGGFIASWFLPH